jgi:hypothetical protein
MFRAGSVGEITKGVVRIPSSEFGLMSLLS